VVIVPQSFVEVATTIEKVCATSREWRRPSDGSHAEPLVFVDIFSGLMEPEHYQCDVTYPSSCSLSRAV
jgi:hypothetical protein